MKLACFGSHKGGILRHVVEGYLTERFDPRVTLMSGGAPEVDSFAEQTWQTLGGDVISLRPAKCPDGDSWTIERWEITNGVPTIYIPHTALEWADWKSAAFWRSMMIADEAERGVAFVSGFSPGTRFTIDHFRGQAKPCAVHEL